MTDAIYNYSLYRRLQPDHSFESYACPVSDEAWGDRRGEWRSRGVLGRDECRPTVKWKPDKKRENLQSYRIRKRWFFRAHVWRKIPYQVRDAGARTDEWSRCGCSWSCILRRQQQQQQQQQVMPATPTTTASYASNNNNNNNKLCQQHQQQLMHFEAIDSEK